MCLTTICSKKKTKEILDGLPDWFTAYKKMTKPYSYKLWRPPYYPVQQTKCGLNTFKTNLIWALGCKKKYVGGSHLYLREKNLNKIDLWDNQKIFKCRVKKEWVKTIGRQNGILVITVEKAIFYVNRKKKLA